jgi:phage tail sheath protein FI
MATPPVNGDLAPGVYLRDVFPQPAPTLLTGVPAFLGYAGQGPVGDPQPLTLWPQFQAQFGAPQAGGFLAYAVRGFFENGGLLCYVVRLDQSATPLSGLRAGLAALQGVDAVDLVCAPDIMILASLTGTPGVDTVTALQAEVLADCQRAGGRFAILDAVLTSDTAGAEQQRAALSGDDGALYHPWLWAPGQDGKPLYLPPCGHVAGIYARSDKEVGVHKAPANEPLNGVLDLRVNLTDDVIGRLYAEGVNCLRAVPGRGIRVWGACTLSRDPAWRPIGARRVFLTMGRWVGQFMEQLTFEPNDVRLWVRIMRELTAYLDDEFQRGALKGSTPEEAFFVKCDSETNPPEVTAAGMVVTNVGVALAAPAEFVIVRIIHGTSGVSIQPVSPPAAPPPPAPAPVVSATA